MKKQIISICLLVCAGILSAVTTAMAQGSLAGSKPLIISKPSVKFTEYNETTGDLKMAVRLRINEGCSQMAVRLSSWNGLEINSDTILFDDMTGRKELSFVSRLTLPQNDTCGIVVKISDAKEVMEAGLGRQGVMIFHRFLVTTGDTLEVFVHPPWEKRSLINKSISDISTQDPFEVTLMRWTATEKPGNITLVFAAWIGYDPRMETIPPKTDEFRWEPIHVKLEPGHGVTIRGETLWADRQPNPGRRFRQIGLSLAPNDTCYATLTTSCGKAVAKIDMKFVTSGDSTEGWWAGPEDEFRPILDWNSLQYGQVGPQDLINTHLDGYNSKYYRGPSSSCRKPFVGSFDFITLPTPNQVAEVVFTLEATDNCIRPGGVGNDWEVAANIWGFENQVQIVGDSEFIWPGPYGPGDTFTDTLRFIPLASGGSSINFNMKMWQRECAIPFTWFLDSEGKLLYLGNPEQTGYALKDLKTVSTVFIDSDTLHLRQYAGQKGQDFFDCETVTTPLPQIGDTTFIRYKLTANRDWDTGLDFLIRPRNIEIVSYPNPLDFAIKKGDSLELAIGILPIPAPGPHSVRLEVCPDCSDRFSYLPSSQDFTCGFVFDDNGKIRYAAIHDYRNLPSSELPNIQFIPGKHKVEEIRVYKSGDVYHGKRLVNSKRRR